MTEFAFWFRKDINDVAAISVTFSSPIPPHFFGTRKTVWAARPLTAGLHEYLASFLIIPKIDDIVGIRI